MILNPIRLSLIKQIELTFKRNNTNLAKNVLSLTERGFYQDVFPDNSQ